MITASTINVARDSARAGPGLTLSPAMFELLGRVLHIIDRRKSQSQSLLFPSHLINAHTLLSGYELREELAEDDHGMIEVPLF